MIAWAILKEFALKPLGALLVALAVIWGAYAVATGDAPAEDATQQ